MRLFRLLVVIVVTAFALISMMFLLMVRVTDPLVPRAIFGVLNTLLYFPSGAVYPQQGFPAWMQAIAVVDPFTYAVHAFKSLLLKNTGFGGDRAGLRLSARLLGHRHDGGDDAVQADAVTARAQVHRRAAGGAAAVGDHETRQRLLDVAVRLFSTYGFKRVTVREICREAGANVAAINYHFGDKLGLYTEVVKTAIDAIRGTSELSMQAGEGGTAEERLRAFVRVFLRPARGHRPRFVDPQADGARDGRPDAGARSRRRAGDPAAPDVRRRHRRRADGMRASRSGAWRWSSRASRGSACCTRRMRWPRGSGGRRRRRARSSTRSPITSRSSRSPGCAPSRGRHPGSAATSVLPFRMQGGPFRPAVSVSRARRAPPSSPRRSATRA